MILLHHIRAVFLDAGQTLFDLKPSYPGAFAQVCRDFGYKVDEADVAAVMPEFIAAEVARIRRGVGFRVTPESLFERWLGLNRFIFERAGITGDSEALSHEMERRFDTGRFAVAYPDAAPAIAALRAAGYRLGIISNGTAGMRACIEHLGLDEGMEFVIVSALVGWEKPHPEIFRAALAHSGLAPGDVIYVGDDYLCDVEGASAAGIQPVWLRRKNSHNNHEHNITVAAPEIASLDDLLPLLSGDV